MNTTLFSGRQLRCAAIIVILIAALSIVPNGSALQFGQTPTIPVDSIDEPTGPDQFTLRQRKGTRTGSQVCPDASAGYIGRL
jgi:hypothetical protein